MPKVPARRFRRAHAGSPVVLLIADLDIRVVNSTTGELLRHLTLNPDFGYHATKSEEPPEPQVQEVPMP